MAKLDSLELPLLLTASVSTRGMVGADFGDEDRERMYLETLRFYGQEVLARDPGQRLVFAENSGWDLKAMAAKLPSELASRIRWVAVDPARFDISRGKGYNEILLINEVVKLLGPRFLKLTGRYPIYNIRYFLRAAKRHFACGGSFYGDMKDHRLFDWLRTGWNGHAAYTVLFATTAEFYQKHLASSYADCNDYTDNWIECVWYRILSPFRGRKASGVSLRFRREPVCGGLQGSNLAAKSFNKRNDSLRAKGQRFVGNCIRWFLPWFWF